MGGNVSGRWFTTSNGIDPWNDVGLIIVFRHKHVEAPKAGEG
jgi:hypothetical protein